MREANASLPGTEDAILAYHSRGNWAHVLDHAGATLRPSTVAVADDFAFNAGTWLGLRIGLRLRLRLGIGLRTRIGLRIGVGTWVGLRVRIGGVGVGRSGVSRSRFAWFFG
jgi:hypothetical protein